MCAAQFYPVATFFFGSGPAKVQSQTLLALSSTSHGARIVTEAMDHFLGRIQVFGRYDGRGIKFVLGRNVYSGFEFYVIDFRQVGLHR